MAEPYLSSVTGMSAAAGAGNKECVQVMIRVRPLLAREQARGRCVDYIDGHTIRVCKGITPYEYSFDHIFNEETTQDEIYEHVRSSVDAVLSGINSTVFAYGQTGTGKTYTMLGLDSDQVQDADITALLAREQRGIIPRAVHQVFEHIRRQPAGQYRVYCSYLEIYNEKIFDLLQYDRSRQLRTGLDLREDRHEGVFVQDLVQVTVSSVEDVLALMLMGARHRATDRTEMNDYSSRSHTIFQLVVECQSEADGPVRRAKLNLVDLAGSEKWRTSYELGPQRIQELTSINQSLSTLCNCIVALTQPGRAHIPFRESKLTRLLQDSLGGNTRTVFIATCSPSQMCLDETISTLKFADRAKRVVLTVRINETMDKDSLIRRYERENGQLKEIIRLLLSTEAGQAAGKALLATLAGGAREQLLGSDGAAVERAEGEPDGTAAATAAAAAAAGSGESGETADSSAAPATFPVLEELGLDVGSSGKPLTAAELVSHIQSLHEENVQLREDTARLHTALVQEREERQRLLRMFNSALESMRQRAGVSDTAVLSAAAEQELEMYRVENEFLRAKVSQLEALEYDQSAKQSELDAYHRWLRSVPLRNDGSGYTATTKEKLELLELSLQRQQAELRRTKQLFASDMSALQLVLSEKADELAAAEQREAALQHQLTQMQQLLASLHTADAQAGGTGVTPRPIDPASAAPTRAAALTAADSVVVEAKDKLERSVSDLEATFRGNLQSAFDLLQSRFLSKQPEEIRQVAEHLHRQTAQVVLGCLRALFDAVRSVQQEAIGKLETGVFADFERQVQLLDLPADSRLGAAQQLEIRKWQSGVVALLRAMRKFLSQTDSELASSEGAAPELLVSRSRRSLQALHEYARRVEQDFTATQFDAPGLLHAAARPAPLDNAALLQLIGHSPASGTPAATPVRASLRASTPAHGGPAVVPSRAADESASSDSGLGAGPDAAAAAALDRSFSSVQSGPSAAARSRPALAVLQASHTPQQPQAVRASAAVDVATSRTGSRSRSRPRSRSRSGSVGVRAGAFSEGILTRQPGTEEQIEM